MTLIRTTSINHFTLSPPPAFRPHLVEKIFSVVLALKSITSKNMLSVDFKLKLSQIPINLNFAFSE